MMLLLYYRIYLFLLIDAVMPLFGHLSKAVTFFDAHLPYRALVYRI